MRRMNPKKAKRFLIKCLGRNGLIKGYITTVDEEDACLLRAHVWTAKNSTRLFNGKQIDFKYIARNVNGVCEFLHCRVINAKEGEKVWHINGDSLDNRKANLMKESERVVELDD